MSPLSTGFFQPHGLARARVQWLRNSLKVVMRGTAYSVSLDASCLVWRWAHTYMALRLSGMYNLVQIAISQSPNRQKHHAGHLLIDSLLRTSFH